MPEVHINDIPDVDDDIGQSAVAGLLLATGIEQMDPPFKTGEFASVQPGIAFRNPKNGFLIPGKDVDGKKITELKYVRNLVFRDDHLLVMGWHIRLEGFEDILFPAHRFSKK